MREPISTPLGAFWLIRRPGDHRIGIRDVQCVDGNLRDPVFRWDLEMEAVIVEAAVEVGAARALISPGAWRITPDAVVDLFLGALAEAAAGRADALGDRAHRLCPPT